MDLQHRLRRKAYPAAFRFIVLSLCAFTAVDTASDYSCGDGETLSFELVTGAIFTSEQGKIASFQTFDLAECIDRCRKNPQCASANFETGLCTTSQMNSSSAPDNLRTDDFPVFPNYVEKMCLRNTEPCLKDWSFQGVLNYYLPGYDTKVIPVGRKEDCLTACLNEDSFACLSAEMRYHNMTCVLSSASQSALQTKLQKNTDPTAKIDYFENNCNKEPRTYCEYNRVRGRVLKAADLVRSKVASLEECKALCLAAGFSCNYYHYGQLSDDECSMSHHTAITVSHISEPYVFSADFVSFELRACFSVELLCEAKKMTARIDTNRVFDGLVYTKEQPKNCLNDVSNSTEFDLAMPLDGSQCATTNNGKGKYSNYIMIQYNDKIVTSKDVGLSVSCEYDLTSRNVTGVLSTNGAPTITENVNYKVPSPVVQMTIRDLSGNPLVSATVGDKIYLQFDLGAAGAPDIYNIFVKDVYAVDGAAAPGKAKIKMIDSNGCPADDIVLGPVETTNNGRTLRIPIEAFKFPSNDEVEFTALIKPCQKQCEPAQCIDEATQIVYNSFGRRRRRAIELPLENETSFQDPTVSIIPASSTSGPAESVNRSVVPSEPRKGSSGRDKDFALSRRININDVYATPVACPGGDCGITSLPYQNIPQANSLNGKQPLDTTGIVCIHKLAIAVGASAILLVQVACAVALAFICQRYRMQRKPRFKASLDISSPKPFVNPHRETVSSARSNAAILQSDSHIYSNCQSEASTSRGYSAGTEIPGSSSATYSRDRGEETEHHRVSKVISADGSDVSDLQC